MADSPSGRSRALLLAALLSVIASLLWSIKAVVGTQSQMDLPLSAMWICIGMMLLAVSRRNRPTPPPSGGDRAGLQQQVDGQS